jgi:oxalate decarboxylase/phosphoglucose isomerase-like protein (cupin superfamily)
MEAFMLISKNLSYQRAFRSLVLFASVVFLPFNVWSAEFDLNLVNVDEYANMKNPTPGEIYRTSILNDEHDANDVAGIFAILVSGKEVPYHYHQERESIVMAIHGEAIQVMEGEEFPIKAGDVFFVPAQTKHQTINRSQDDFRFLEFYTNAPDNDRVMVE